MRTGSGVANGHERLLLKVALDANNAGSKLRVEDEKIFVTICVQIFF